MKNKFKALLMLSIFLCVSAAYGQKRATLSGIVTDKKTGETIIGAVIRIPGLGATGTATNEYGFYSISMVQAHHTVIIGYMGYKEDTVSVNLDKDTQLNVALTPAAKLLKEVTVSSKIKNEQVTSAQMGMEKLNIKDISEIPVLFGEKDVMKTIQLLPGIKSAGEGGSGYFVRGGTSGQNLILLDEAPVYNPSHLLGFFSTFNSDAIKDAAIFKGGMPAQYGGRLSSVLDLKMNDGNNQDYAVSGGLGLISSKLNVEGPIRKGSSSFLVSARRTYADAFLKLSPDSNYNNNALYFYDVNGKVNFKLSDKDRLYLSVYTGKDKLGFGKAFGMDWGNQTGTLRWNHMLSGKMFSNTSLIFSNYHYNINYNMGSIHAKIHSEIRDWNLKEEIELFSSPGNSFRFGVNSVYHTMTPGEVTGSISAKLQDRFSWENAAFFSSKWAAASKLNIEYGIRFSTFSVLGKGDYYKLDEQLNVADTLHYSAGEFVKTYFNPEPRISASYMLNEQSSVKAAYSRNTQYLHLMSNSTASNPTDKWVPSDNIIKPEIADQVSLGYFRNIHDGAYELSIEGYYKYLQNQIDYRDGADVLAKDAIETQLLFGKGRAYGVELLLKKKTGRFTGWVSYTLSRSEKHINNINNNNWYPTRQDRTHDISIVGIYKLSDRWTVSGTWVCYTGDAVTFPSGKYEVDNHVQLYYTERNGYRMPTYHRLDLGATYQLKHGKHFSSELAFSLYNAYGRENAYTVEFKQNKDNPNIMEAEQTSLFKWIPSISYNFKF